MSIFWVIGAVVAMFLGVGFLGEHLTTAHMLGAVLVILSVVVVFGRKRLFTLNKGVLLAFVATTCAAIAVVNDTIILREYNAISFTPVASFLPLVVLIAVKPRSLQSLQRLKEVRFLKMMLLIASLYALQAYVYYTALNFGANISQVSPLYKN